MLKLNRCLSCPAWTSITACGEEACFVLDGDNCKICNNYIKLSWTLQQTHMGSWSRDQQTCMWSDRTEGQTAVCDMYRVRFAIFRRRYRNAVMWSQSGPLFTSQRCSGTMCLCFHAFRDPFPHSYLSAELWSVSSLVLNSISAHTVSARKPNIIQVGGNEV